MSLLHSVLIKKKSIYIYINIPEEHYCLGVTLVVKPESVKLIVKPGTDLYFFFGSWKFNFSEEHYCLGVTVVVKPERRDEFLKNIQANQV